MIYFFLFFFLIIFIFILNKLIVFNSFSSLILLVEHNKKFDNLSIIILNTWSKKNIKSPNGYKTVEFSYKIINWIIIVANHLLWIEKIKTFSFNIILLFSTLSKVINFSKSFCFSFVFFLRCSFFIFIFCDILIILKRFIWYYSAIWWKHIFE